MFSHPLSFYIAYQSPDLNLHGLQRHGRWSALPKSFQTTRSLHHSVILCSSGWKLSSTWVNIGRCKNSSSVLLSFSINLSTSSESSGGKSHEQSSLDWPAWSPLHLSDSFSSSTQSNSLQAICFLNKKYSFEQVSLKVTLALCKQFRFCFLSPYLLYASLELEKLQKKEEKLRKCCG